MTSPAFQILPPPGIRHVLVRDLLITGSIGILPEEHRKLQRIRVNLILAVPETGTSPDEKIENVVDYNEIIIGVRRVVGAGHVELIETLADRIAALCLEDRRIKTAFVQVEKLDVYTDAAAVGIAIQRENLSI